MKPIREITERLRATLRRRGKSREDAEDLVQQAFLRYETHRLEQDIREPEAFVVRTALNLSIDEDRRRRRAPFSDRPLENLPLVDSSPRQDEVLDARIRLRRLSEGLDALKPRTRSMLLAQRLEGLSYAEIARREGITVSAVEKQIARAILFLMDWMEGW